MERSKIMFISSTTIMLEERPVITYKEHHAIDIRPANNNDDSNRMQFESVMRVNVSKASIPYSGNRSGFKITIAFHPH